MPCRRPPRSATRTPSQLKDAAFDWEDPLDLEGELTEEERMVRDTARGYAQEKLFPRVLRPTARSASTARSCARWARSACSARPSRGVRRRRARLRRLRADRARDRARRFRLPLGDVGAVLAGHAPDLSPMAARRSGANICRSSRRGEIVGCFGLTEPDHGSDPGSMVTRAEKAAGGYRLTGAKMWITNAPIADLAVVWAKLDGKIRGFIVERGTKGFSTPKIEGKLSLRASITGEIVLEGALVPEENLLPNVKGLAGPFGCLNMARYGIAWGAIGRGRVLLASRPPIRARPQAVRPAARRQSARCRRSSPTCRPRSRSACTRRCALGRLMEAGKAAPPAISLLKRNNCGKALDIARARARHARRQRHLRRIPCHARAVQSRNRQHL